jgi:hypothetical protein
MRDDELLRGWLCACSPTDIGNFLSGADDYAITYVGVDPQQYQQANR